jgi:hypothetical protein
LTKVEFQVGLSGQAECRVGQADGKTVKIHKKRHLGREKRAISQKIDL